MGKVLIKFLKRSYTTDHFVNSFLRILNLFGCWNVQMKESKPVLRVSIIFSISLVCFTMFDLGRQFSLALRKGARVSHMLFLFSLGLLCLTVASTTLVQIFYKNKFGKFFQNLSLVTKMTLDNKKELIFNGPPLCPLVFCSLSFILRMFFFPFITLDKVNLNLFNAITICSLSIACQVHLFIFNTFLYVIKMSLIELKHTIPNSANVINVDQVHTKLNKVCLSFNYLCTASSQLNSLFTRQLFFYISFFLLILCLDPYILMRSFSLSDFMIVVLWLSTTGAAVLSIVHQCTSIQTLVAQFHDRLYRIMMEDFSQNLLENRQYELHLTLRREIIFTAGGFIPIDYKLIHSILAAVTTYLVVLVQYGDSV